MTQFLDELEAVPVDLPLVPRVVTQVGRHGLLDLQISKRHYSEMSGYQKVVKSFQTTTLSTWWLVVTCVV